MPPKKYNFERILKEEIKTLFLEQEKQRAGQHPGKPGRTAEEKAQEEFKKELTVDFISEDDYRYSGHAKPADLIPISYSDLAAVGPPKSRNIQITDVNWVDRQQWSYGTRCAAGLDQGKTYPRGGRDSSRCPHLGSEWYRYQKKRIDQIRRSLIYYRSECSRTIRIHHRSEKYDKRGLLACKMIIRLEYELEEREQYIEKERKLWFQSGASMDDSSAQFRADSEAAMFARWKKMVHETSRENNEAAEEKIYNLSVSSTSERRKEIANFRKKANCPPRRKRTTERVKKVTTMWRRAEDEAKIRLAYTYGCANKKQNYSGVCAEADNPEQWYANIELYWALRKGGFIDESKTRSEPALKKLRPGTNLGDQESQQRAWDQYKQHSYDWQDKEKLGRDAASELEPQKRNTVRGIPKLKCRQRWPGGIDPKKHIVIDKSKTPTYRVDFPLPPQQIYIPGDTNPHIPGKQSGQSGKYKGPPGEHGTADGRQGGGSIQANPRLLAKLKELSMSTTKWGKLAKRYRKYFGWVQKIHGDATGTTHGHTPKRDAAGERDMKRRHDQAVADARAKGLPPPLLPHDPPTAAAFKGSYDTGDSLAFTRAYWTKFSIPAPNMIVCFAMALLNSDRLFNRTASDDDHRIHMTMRNLFEYLRTDMEQHGRLTGFLDSCTELCGDVDDSTGPCKKIIVGLDTHAPSCDARAESTPAQDRQKDPGLYGGLRSRSGLGGALSDADRAGGGIEKWPGWCSPKSCVWPKWYLAAAGTESMRARAEENMAKCVKDRRKYIAKHGPCIPLAGKVGAMYGCAASDTAYKCMNKRCKLLGKRGKAGSTHYDLEKALKAFKTFCGPELFAKPIAINGFGIPWDFETAETEPYRQQTKTNCEGLSTCVGTTCWKTYIKEYQEYLRGKHECEEITCSKRAFANLGEAKRQNCINACMEDSKELFKLGGPLHHQRLNKVIKDMKEECKNEQRTGGKNVYNPYNPDTLNLGRAFVLPPKCIPTGEHHENPSGFMEASDWFTEWFLQPEDIAMELAGYAGAGFWGAAAVGVMVALMALGESPDLHTVGHKWQEEEDFKKEREKRKLQLLAIPLEDIDPSALESDKLLPGIEQEKEEEEEEEE